MDYLKLHDVVVRHNTKGKYRFVDRRKGLKKLCLYLIGYKSELWPDVVSRFKKFIPEDVEVCLLSSGRFIPAIDCLAEENGWSYLSTKKNNVCLIQNIAIDLFSNAVLIYKIDEDIFLTENTFQKLENAIINAERIWPYKVGMAAPLLNVNAYGYYRILEKTGKLKDFELLFGKAYMESGQKSMIESNLDVARFLWGDGGYLPSIDDLNKNFSNENDISICPIRLSIGCVLYKRSFWESFWRFPVVLGNGMGLDETVALGAAVANSQILVVAENSVVGHFGYGPQTRGMLEFYHSHRELFAL